MGDIVGLMKDFEAGRRREAGRARHQEALARPVHARRLPEPAGHAQEGRLVCAKSTRSSRSSATRCPKARSLDDKTFTVLESLIRSMTPAERAKAADHRQEPRRAHRRRLRPQARAGRRPAAALSDDAHDDAEPGGRAGAARRAAGLQAARADAPVQGRGMADLFGDSGQDEQRHPPDGARRPTADAGGMPGSARHARMPGGLPGHAERRPARHAPGGARPWAAPACSSHPAWTPSSSPPSWAARSPAATRQVTAKGQGQGAPEAQGREARAQEVATALSLSGADAPRSRRNGRAKRRPFRRHRRTLGFGSRLAAAWWAPPGLVHAADREPRRPA